MSGPLKSKSFQPLTGVRDTAVLFCPYLCDPGLHRRMNYSYRKPMDAQWTLLRLRPERRHCPVTNEPETPAGLQNAVIIAQRVARDLVVTPPHPDLDEVLAGQDLGGEVSH